MIETTREGNKEADKRQESLASNNSHDKNCTVSVSTIVGLLLGRARRHFRRNANLSRGTRRNFDNVISEDDDTTILFV